MHHETNPFIQHAARQGQLLINASNTAAAASNELISVCDEIIYNINHGNMQGALASAQNARNIAGQIANNTQHLNRAIHERISMASYVLSRMQQHINEIAGALQGISGAVSNPHSQYYQQM
ncbi:hypothetical protein GFC01_08810 [Desulfofundulus thermobenzoicus]|uniref:Flagellin n=1 Tax=Desulfofundulus thermobenzoicus TaxID=29376 RepID=A0A6N7IQR2_9FIRM|nr:hypothetical protein [Desulfofundulus thermobenzoicus]MQL52362.1 hypothetical protein [Desulfofundulus thermobenzoicus]HHW42520.1 hypothetical protein [Desulfotomaculum sp.]